MGRSRVVFIAICSGDPELIRRWTASGDMPAVAGLLARSRVAETRGLPGRLCRGALAVLDHRLHAGAHRRAQLAPVAAGQLMTTSPPPLPRRSGEPPAAVLGCPVGGRKAVLRGWTCRIRRSARGSTAFRRWSGARTTAPSASRRRTRRLRRRVLERTAGDPGRGHATTGLTSTSLIRLPAMTGARRYDEGDPVSGSSTSRSRGTSSPRYSLEAHIAPALLWHGICRSRP